MRNIFFIFFALLSISGLAQKIDFTNKSNTVFVFKISDEEAVKVQNSESNITNKLLHSFVDTFNINKPIILPVGHYIHARILNENIKMTYVPVLPYSIFMYKEYGVFTIQILDDNDVPVKDAKVKLGKRRVYFDRKNNTFSLKDTDNDPRQLLYINAMGMTSSMDISKITPYKNNRYNNSSNTPNYFGYMITDKNKYKPGDTIRFKSYSLTGKRYPIKGPLRVSIYNGRKTILIDTITPYHPGGYAGEIVLHDSLELKLDRSYSIHLSNKHRTIISHGFKYEDYELSDSKIEVHTDQTHFFPRNNELKISATDANGLLLKDVKAEVFITRVNINDVFTDYYMLKDTIVKDTVDLDPQSPTIIKVPAELFGKANCTYSVYVCVRTFDNRLLEYKRNINFYYKHASIIRVAVGDSLHYKFKKLDEDVIVPATLQIDDTIKNIVLPYSLKINHNAKQYKVSTRQGIEEYTNLVQVSSLDAGFELDGGFDKNDFKIKLINPMNLDVSWYVYVGGNLIEKGYGKELDFKLRNTDLKTVHYVELFYVMGGMEKLFRKDFSPKTQFLDIETNLPEKVYPGQKVDAQVKVKDHMGRPQSKVDLTAFAYNSMLNYYVPDLPYYGKPATQREQEVYYEKSPFTRSNTIRLDTSNWNFWNRLANLDKLEYYRFTYPQKRIFKHYEKTPDSSTQFTIYAMYKGQPEQIHVIEKNNVPIYFSWTNQAKAYSFLADSGKQKLSIRTNNYIIVFDSLIFNKGHKTTISIDLEYAYETAGVYPSRSSNFSSMEGARYKQYISFLPVDNNMDFTYLKKDSTIYPIWNRGKITQYLGIDGKNEYFILAGPVPPGMMQYFAGYKKTIYERSPLYKHLGGYLYNYEDNVVYKTNYEVLNKNNINYMFKGVNDFKLELDDFLNTSSVENKWYPSRFVIDGKTTHVDCVFPQHKDTSGVVGLLVQRSQDGVIVYPDIDNLNHIEDGLYNIILLYKNCNYLKYDSVEIKNYAYIKLDMSGCKLQEHSIESLNWLSRYYESQKKNLNTTTSYNATSSVSTYTLARATSYGNNVTGIVITSDGEPAPFVNVLIKGTTKGVTTDIDGHFAIAIDQSPSILVFSYIGYRSKEINVIAGSNIRVTLEEEAALLEEAVVIGYSRVQKREVSASVSTISLALSGKSSGIYLEKSGSEMDFKENESIDEDEDDESEISSDAIYQELLLINSLRSNFSDVGFWKPDLITNKNGEASFSILFPDNITQWNSVIYAMNKKLNTGTYRKSIKSYKPIMAELKVPQFLTATDSCDFGGTIRNYTKDSLIRGNVIFTAYGDTLYNKAESFSGFIGQRFGVNIDTASEIKVQYSLRRDDGYFDGEERKIDVEPMGTEMGIGDLRFLRNDESIIFEPTDGEKVNLKLTGRTLDVYLDVSKSLIEYKYACNEQLASKLTGLVIAKLSSKYAGVEFKYDKDVNAIIKRLLDNQTNKGSWSWWGRSESNVSTWMSAHILRSLTLARDAGYKVDLQTNNLTSAYGIFYNYKAVNLEDLNMFYALNEWGIRDINPKQAITIFDSLIKTQEKLSNYSFLYEKLLLTELRQKLNLEYTTDTLLKYVHKNIFNEISISDKKSSRYWYYDNLMTNLTAYRIIRADSTLRDSLLMPLQMHILSTRQYGWNTYRSASALITILPDIMAEGATAQKPSTVTLLGNQTKELYKFPFDTIINANEKLEVRKDAGSTIICSWYKTQRVYNERSTDAFEVKTYLPEVLEAGKPVTMKVKVNVKKEGAEYVMIEVPIPGSCSYSNKVYGYGEAHREYFKEKTVIFCTRMNVGEYDFEINLLPRFSGRYTINPAKVEMMYFPMINANTDLKKVDVIQK